MEKKNWLIIGVMVIFFILIVLFISFSPNEILFSVPENISECLILDTAGKTYILDNDISILEDVEFCFKIGAHDITLDGNGHTISAEESVTYESIINIADFKNIIIKNLSMEGQLSGYGILVEEVENITIEDSNISKFKTGVNFISVNDSFIIGNKITNQNLASINFEDSHNNKISNNFLSNTFTTIKFLDSSNNTLKENNLNYSSWFSIWFVESSYNNLIVNNNISHGMEAVVLQDGSDYNEIVNNTMYHNSLDAMIIETDYNKIINTNIISVSGQDTISIFGGNSNILINNTISGGANGYRLQMGAENNTIIGGIINETEKNAIYFPNVGDSCKKNIFTNVTIIGKSPSHYDLNIENGTGGNLHFIDTEIKNFSINGGYLLTFENSKFGKVEFLEPIIGKDMNLNKSILIEYNLSFVDSENIPEFNKKANITFYDLPTDWENTEIQVNGKTCSVPLCIPFTNLDAGTVKFGVIGWSNYSIYGEIPEEDFTIEAPLNTTYNSEDFPLGFKVNLSEVGTVWYNLDGGINITMNTTDNLTFTHEVLILSEGSHTLEGFAEIYGEMYYKTIVFGVEIGNEENNYTSEVNDTEQDISGENDIWQDISGENDIWQDISGENEQENTYIAKIVFILIILVISVLIVMAIVFLIKNFRKKGISNEKV